MTSVSNQLPYTKLTPLPVQQDGCPRLQKLIVQVSLAVPVIGYSACFGMYMGMAEWWGISLVTGAIMGSIMGTVMSIALAIFIPTPSKLCQYRLDTLAQIEGTLSKEEPLRGIQQLKKVFADPLEQFSYPFSSHVFYSNIAAITAEIERPDIKEVWTCFLKHLDKTKVKNPDGTELMLNFDMEFERLDKNEILMEASYLQKGWFDSFDEEAISQIEKIQEVSFSKGEALSKEIIKERIAKGTCLIVRRRNSSEILGYSLFHVDRKGVHIDQIARKPSAARLSIGSTLLYAILREQDENTPTQLKLHKNNPAQKLFTQWGFVATQELEGAYPPESGILMQLDWKKYQESLKFLKN